MGTVINGNIPKPTPAGWSLCAGTGIGGAVLIHGRADPQKSISEESVSEERHVQPRARTDTYGAARWLAATQCAPSLRIVSPHCEAE